MTVSHHKLTVYINVMAIKIVFGNAREIMRHALTPVHVIQGVIMDVRVHMKVNIAKVVKRALKKNITFVRN